MEIPPVAAVVVDVGGGSTEWIATQAGEISQVVSLTLGSLRCALDLKADPPSAASLDRLRRRIQKALAGAVLVSDPAWRARALEHVVLIWARREPAAAALYVQNCPALSAAQQAAIRGKIK